MKIIYVVVAVVFFSCGGVQKDKDKPGEGKEKSAEMVFVKTGGDSACNICQRNKDGFRHAFDRFYVDSSNRFYVASSLLRPDSSKKLAFSQVFVEIPTLDAATYRTEGWYLMDRSKVLCVFENSDGGSYVELKGVDPTSFKAFKHVFGGRDKDHVFFQHSILDGLDPAKVRVYSNLKNCPNCDGYFKDDRFLYYDVDKMGDRKFVIPKEFAVIE